VSPSVLRI